MEEARIARRYSQALFAVASATGQLEVVASDLATVAQVAKDNPELVRLLQHPRLHQEEKKRMLRAALDGKVSPQVVDFLCLLIDRKRFVLIGAIAGAFQQQVNQWRNLVVAEVTTAIPLSEDEKRMFVDRLRAITGKHIELHTYVDPSLIAGAKVVMGGKMIDATVAMRLRSVREQLKKVRVV